MSVSMSDVVELAPGVVMPRLGLGTYQVADLDRVVADALDVGYRRFDTAASYGNELVVGRALADGQLPRDQIFVTTKLANDAHGELARDAFSASLARLGTGYVDLYLIHWPLPARDDYVKTWRVLEEILEEGRVRAIGVSNFEPEHLLRLRDAGARTPAVNQIELHPYFQQSELRTLHDELGILTESWSPLGRGAVFEDPVLRAIAQDRGVSVAQVIVRWHLQLGLATVPKASSRARLVENLAAFDLELSEEEMERIRLLDRGVRRGPDPLAS